MINEFLSTIFTPEVIANMGDYWYEVVYSWSVFAALCGLVLCCLFAVYSVYKWLWGCFR